MRKLPNFKLKKIPKSKDIKESVISKNRVLTLLDKVINPPSILRRLKNQKNQDF